eukprot:TRINITY_DN111745_c0_g1_i1.p1 TRINITY_DN111745_c0_g1~~TRINITY_DN111745_c0_g1_i1.p1  ORF type:complete len:401 (+),score=71.70 TRINITY_DN111745_c0_g1_i1:107-1309(+)
MRTLSAASCFLSAVLTLASSEDPCGGHRCDSGACPCGCECGNATDPGVCYAPKDRAAEHFGAASLPKTMRAWYLDAYPSTAAGLKFKKDYPVPQPKADEVLINVKASSVNPIDYKILSPALHAAFPLHFPAVLGFEAAGVVAAVGPGTSGHLKVGDEVWADMGVQIQYLGGYADYVAVPERLVALKPKGLSFTQAASLPLVGMTAVQGFEKAQALNSLEGKTVLILGGSGGVGSVCIELARNHYKAAKVITTTSSENVDFVKKLGADQVIDYHAANWWDVVEDGTVDFIFDTVGQQGTGPRATHKLKMGGGGVFLTIAQEGPSVGLDSNPPPNSVQIFHLLGYVPGTLELLGKIVDAGEISAHVQQTYPLEDLKEAWATSEKGHVVGKLAISLDAGVLVV